MDIVILANFCMDFSDNDNGRFKYLANMLSQDNQVEIITSSFFHLTKEHRRVLNTQPYKITLIDEPGYKKNVSVKRFVSHFIWGINVIQYLKKRRKPDVVYCAVPSLTAPYFVAKYCEQNSIRFIVDIQDLWPESFQMVLNVPIISKIIFFPFKLLADGIYKRADDIVAVSQTYVDRALCVNRKVKEGHAVFLGTNLDTFDKNSKTAVSIEKPTDEIWIAYCGTLGKSYDLKCIINALALYNNNSIRFIIMGDGPQKRELMEYSKQKQVNAFFYGQLPYNKMCALLCKCDITVNPIIGTSVASIINKHADYAASGLPVINTQNSSEYIRLIEEYNMGYSAKSGDSNEVFQLIKTLVDNKSIRKKMGINARRCAEEKFNRKYTYSQIVQLIIKR